MSLKAQFIKPKPKKPTVIKPNRKPLNDKFEKLFQFRRSIILNKRIRVKEST